MKKLSHLFTSKRGISLVETVIAMSILSIIVISVVMVITMTAKTGLKDKRKIQANQFAQAIIDDFRTKDYELIIDDSRSYQDFMGLSSVSASSDMHAEWKVEKRTEMTLNIYIEISWSDPSAPDGKRIEKYYTVVNPKSTTASGGIVKGRVVYIAQLDNDPMTSVPLHRIPIVRDGFAKTPDTMYDESKEAFYEGAHGLTVQALSNNKDESYTTTSTDGEGYFTLRNVKIDPSGLTSVPLYFFKSGSEPNASVSEQAYYFFDTAVPVPLDPNVDYPINQRGFYQKDIFIKKPKEERILGTIVCARCWNFYVKLGYEDMTYDWEPDPIPYEFQAANYADSSDTICVSSDTVRWGLWNCFNTGSTYWDFSKSILSPIPPATLPEARGFPYNLVIRNIRQVFFKNNKNLPVEFSIKEVTGSAYHIPHDDPDFKIGTCAFTYLMGVNPTKSAPFGSGTEEYNYHLIAPVDPLAFPLNGVDIGKHTQEFQNTMGLIEQINVPRFGWMTGTVVDYLGNPVNGATFKFHNNSEAVVTKKNGTQDGTFELNNLFKESLNFKNYSMYLYAQGTDSSGRKYWGAVNTVNGFPYYDTNASAKIDQENKISIQVLPAIKLKGWASMENNASGIPMEKLNIYVYSAVGYRTEIAADISPGGDFRFNTSAIDPFRILQSNRNTETGPELLPVGITSEINPIMITFDKITVKDKAGSIPIAGAEVKVKSYLFESSNSPPDSWFIRWDSGAMYKKTDVSGQVADSMHLPLIGLYKRPIVASPINSPDFVILNLNNADGKVDPIDLSANLHRFDDPIDAGHTRFYAIVVNHDNYNEKIVYYTAILGSDSANWKWIPDKSDASQELNLSGDTTNTDGTINGTDGFINGTTLDGTIFMTAKSAVSTTDITFTLLFKNVLDDICVDQIIIKDNTGTHTITSASVGVGFVVTAEDGKIKSYVGTHTLRSTNTIEVTVKDSFFANRTGILGSTANGTVIPVDMSGASGF